MILPLPTTRVRRHRLTILATVSIVIVTVLTYSSTGVAHVVRSSNQVSFQAGSEAAVPFRAPGSDMYVYDFADVLTSGQAARHKFDLERLNNAGVPAVIYIRRSDDSRNESIAYAEQLRTEWMLESSPGGDDGILILVSLSEELPRRNSLVLSLGRNALPIGQLTTVTMQEIYDKEMQPAFRKNEIDLALSFGVRRMLYYEQYTPPNPPSLSDRQQTARTLAPWSVFLAALYGASGPLLWTRQPRILSRLHPPARTRRVFRIILATLLVLSAGLSLYGRSAPWLVVSVLGAIVVFLGIRLAIAWREMRRRGSRVSRVRSRGRRSTHPTILAHRRPRGLRNA